MTKNNLTRPFYIFLASKIIDNADGALAETLGENCQELLESHPDFLIDFLYLDNPIAEKNLFTIGLKIFAEEFMIGCEGKILF